MGCKDCTKRHIGCHANCEDYKEDIARRKAEKEKIFKAKDHERDLNNQEYSRIEYAKKRKKGKVR